jgi:tripartite-type tricarboxylate transporter receptor subunit TctC
MMQFTQRVLYPLAAAVCCMPWQAAWAQPYPSKVVRIIVPFGTGGPADIYARFLGQRMQEPLGQSFVIDDRPGAGSIIGTDLVAKSPADGYTLLLMSNTHTINESLVPKKPFALMKDFVPVAPINYSDLLLVVHPSVPAKSVKELIALAKSKPHGLNYASSGTGTPYHMAGELFKAMAHVDIVHVPHKSSGDARTSVMSGQVEMMLDAITTMASTAKSGRVRALATTGKKRSTIMPDVPTVSEAGVPGYEAPIWIGLMAPAGTPKPVVDRLNAELQKLVQSPDVQQRIHAEGGDKLTSTPEEYVADIDREATKWGTLIRKLNLKVE